MEIQKPDTQYPVVIIGGGMVGASFALALQKQLPVDSTLRILVVEAVVPGAGNNQPSFDSRSTALSFGSRKIFEQLGIWSSLSDSAEAIHRIHVSDAGHFGSTGLDREQLNVEALGYVVENRSLGIALNEALRDSPALELLCPATLESAAPTAAGMRLALRCGEQRYELQTGLLVLVDGGRSPVCRQLGIPTRVEHYGQQAIISTIAFEECHANRAFERFTDSGPLAVLPLQPHAGENRGALVWTVAEAEVDALLQLSEPELLERLQQCFGYRLGRITRMGKRAMYPLSLTVAQEQVRPGLALLGNVAHTLHPVAGQGFNLSLRDAQALARIVGAALVDGEEPGSMGVLQQFLQQQEKDQHRTIDFSHYLTRVFSSRKTSMVWARKAGLAAIDLVPALKREFARQAMGMADK